MTGLFLAPATNREGAYDHFCKTVLEGVPRELYTPHTEMELESTARIWGLTSSTESTWKSINKDDWLLFYIRENEYRYAVKVAGKEHNPELGNTLRKEMLEDVNDDRDWDFLLYLTEPVSVSVSGDKVADLFDYGNRYPVRFMPVIEKRLKSLEDDYGNIEEFIAAIRK